MGYAAESGYIPTSVNVILANIMANINAQFTPTIPYTWETFVGSNMYKYMYAAAQEMQKNEIKASEIFQKLQQYFIITNEKILRPATTAPGIIGVMAKSGYIASVKPPLLADAGKLFVAVDVDDGAHAFGTFTITNFANLLTTTPDTITVGATVFTAQASAATLGTTTFQATTSNSITATSLATQINAHATASTLVKARAIGAVVTVKAIHGGTGGNAIAINYTDNAANVGATKSGTTLTGGINVGTYAAAKLAINTILKDSVAAGIVTQGTEGSSIVLTNGQSFDWKFYLPNRLTTKLRLTTTLSENNQLFIEAPETVKLKLLANVTGMYRLGKNFEPQRYFTVLDAPWASQVLLEWSTDDGATWSSSVYDSNFDDLFEVSLANITLIEA